MSIINVEDAAHVRLRAPDLVAMRAFLEDFGLTAVESTDHRLVMRGAGTASALHVTEPGFAGVAFRAAPPADLERLAAAEGAAVEDLGDHVHVEIARLGAIENPCAAEV